MVNEHEQKDPKVNSRNLKTSGDHQIWTGPARIRSTGLCWTPARLSWSLNWGSIPPGFCVERICSTENCISPHHLGLISRRDLMLKCCRTRRAQTTPTPEVPVRIRKPKRKETRRWVKTPKGLQFEDF